MPQTKFLNGRGHVELLDAIATVAGGALLSVLVAAVGKEVWDAQGHGTPDRIDALVTVIGGVIMVSWLTLVS